MLFAMICTSSYLLLADHLSTRVYPDDLSKLIKFNTAEMRKLREYQVQVRKDQQKEAFDEYLEK